MERSIKRQRTSDGANASAETRSDALEMDSPPSAGGGSSNAMEGQQPAEPQPPQQPPQRRLLLQALLAAETEARGASGGDDGRAPVPLLPQGAGVIRELAANRPRGSGTSAAAQAGAAVPLTKPAPWTLQVFFDDPDAYDASADILHQPVNVEGDTALYLAAKAGNEAAVRALLAVPNTDSDKQNHKGITPLSIAAHKGKKDIVQMLLAHKPPADVNRASNNGSTPLIQASHFGHLDVVQCLLDVGAVVDQSNKKGTTSLMRATQEGNEAVVRMLITAKADVNIRNNERMNALMLGSQRGHAHIVKVLIDHGAEIDGQTAQGSTALMLACKRGHVEVVRTLLTAGAEMYGQDSRGRTARETAAKRQHTKITDILTGPSQTRLMQKEARTKRALMLSWLYKGHSSGESAKALRIDEAAVASSASLAMLRRVFELNEPVFERIAQLLPLPRLWRAELQRLQRRSNINPNEAIIGAMRLFDDIFTDLVLVTGRGLGPQEGHITRIKADPALQARLLQEMGMPPELLAKVLELHDVQSIVARMKPAEVKFDASVAQKVVAKAAEMVRWYECRENKQPFRLGVVDIPASPAAILSDAAVIGGHASNGANTEDESSDGEMDG